MTKEEALKRLDEIRGDRAASLDCENWIFESGLREEMWSVYLARFISTKGSYFFGTSIEEVVEAAEKYVQETG